MNEKEMRQVIEGSAQIAQVVVNYYFELKQCGLEEDEALELAKGYQDSVLNIGNRGKNE